MLARALRSIQTIAIGLLATHAASAQLYRNTDVDPFEVRSASGAWTLFVDPSSSTGIGPASYRLAHGAELAWTKSFPFTLENLFVGEDGVFAGTAHDRDEDHTLTLAVIANDGTPRYQKALAFQSSMMHGPDFPLARGLFADPEHDRVVFRIDNHLDNDEYEEWRAVRWSTGEVISSTRPSPPVERERGFSSVFAAVPIGGVPLVACCWLEYQTDWEAHTHSQGARFAVLDHDAHAVWKLDLPHDYEKDGDDRGESQLLDWVRTSGQALVSTAPKRFDALVVADAQRVTFEVTADAAAKDGWSVREVAREPHAIVIEPSERMREKAEVKFAPLAVSFLGAIELQVGKSAPSEIYSFDIDDRGRMGHMVTGKDKSSRFELRDSRGAVVHDIPLALPPIEKLSAPSAIWIRGDRWLLYARTWDEQALCLAWWLDLPAGTLTELVDFDCSPIEQADGTFDGGFVALTSKSMEYTIETTLSSFDSEGHLRWRDSEAYGQSEDGLFAAKDVRVSPRGEIGVLDNIRNLIQSFDAKDCKLTGALELEKILGREPEYPTELGVTPEGNWIVYDFSGSPSVLRISHEGQSTASFTPHFGDGRPFMPKDGIHVAPDGRMWATDGFSLVRLDDSGAVDAIAGEAPDANSLGQVECAFLDSTGRALLADERTHAVHVFDGEGKRVAVCNLAPEDVGEQSEVGCIAVGSDGSVHVGLGDYSVSKYVVFQASGQRLRSDALAGRSLFEPGKSLRWNFLRDGVRLLDAAGAEKKKLLRGFDNRWLDCADEACLAADGSLAVLSRGRLHVFSGEGEPIASVDAVGVPEYSCSAFADTRVFFAYDKSVWCLDLATHSLRKADFGQELTSSAEAIAWRTEANELWLLDAQAKKVLRYRVQK